MSHPYRGLPEYQFWSRAVADVPPHQLDPVVSSELTIGAEDRVATMGSCFAQHLSRHLQGAGIDYLVTESGGDLDPSERRERNFGIFSARYGNVYTVRQAVQLFDRAFGDWSSLEPPWALRSAVVDPFRPRIEPEGFADADALEADRKIHLAAVRRVFEEATVLVLTLGLTEGWRSIRDGSVFPLAPGVAGGEYDPAAYEFVNFDIWEVRADLEGLIARFRSVKPTGQVLLTVSPVPLVATFEPRPVLVSTTYSKSVLRTAAEEASRNHDHVHYFPAFEIITSSVNGGRYYADDLREVTGLGVRHVMRVFGRHYLGHGGDLPGPKTFTAEQRSEYALESAVVCDEEAIERSL